MWVFKISKLLLIYFVVRIPSDQNLNKSFTVWYFTKLLFIAHCSSKPDSFFAQPLDFDKASNMPKDLLFPSQADERRKHKLKRLIQSPNSFFMDVKCPGCFHITTVFSHAQVSCLDKVSTLSIPLFQALLY